MGYVVNTQLAEACERLPDDCVPVVLVFLYPDGRTAMLPFSTAWSVMAELLTKAANEIKAKAEVEALLKRH